jgi:hypothetical protein
MIDHSKVAFICMEAPASPGSLILMAVCGACRHPAFDKGDGSMIVCKACSLHVGFIDAGIADAQAWKAAATATKTVFEEAPTAETGKEKADGMG